jgi:hypothetical protein
MPAKKGTRPPAAGRGRKKGEANRLTKAAKECFELAFNGIGGVDGLITWAKRNRTEFYRLYARLIPDGSHLVASATSVSVTLANLPRGPVSPHEAALAYQQIMQADTLEGVDLNLGWERIPDPVVAEVPAAPVQSELALAQPPEPQAPAAAAPKPRPANVVDIQPRNPRLATWERLGRPG